MARRKFKFLEAIALSIAALSLVSCAKDLRVEKGIFAQPQGKTLGMTIYQPRQPAPGQRPGMIMIHGGGWRFGPRWQQLWYCRQFARAGYVVMSIDYRLMPKWTFPYCLYDCKAAVRWLRMHAPQYQVDPDRIVAFGASAGGHLAALLAATNPQDGLEGPDNPGPSSAIRAAVSLYGVVDLTKYRQPQGGNWFDDRVLKGILKFAGNEVAKQGQDPLAAASPITYAKPGMAPVFLAHGMADQIVHAAQSVAFYERLRQLGVPTQLLTFPNRNHGFDYIHHKQRAKMFNQMLAFLQQHNKPISP